MPSVIVAVGLPHPAVHFVQTQRGMVLDGNLLRLHGRPICQVRIASPMQRGEEAWRQPTSETLLLTTNDLTFLNAWSKLSGLLRTVGFLLENGATGAQVLSTGRYPTNDRWIELRDEAVHAVEDLARTIDPEQQMQARYSLMGALRDAFVSQFLTDGADVFSCGMHSLGKPDIVMAAPADDKASHASCLTAIRFEEYLLAEAPMGALQEGHTFSTQHNAQHWRLTREPCSRYPVSNPFHNPWGYWRLSPLTAPGL